MMLVWASSLKSELNLNLGGETFQGVDESVLKLAFRLLQKDRKAEIIGDDGVKFF